MFAAEQSIETQLDIANRLILKNLNSDYTNLDVKINRSVSQLDRNSVSPHHDRQRNESVYSATLEHKQLYTEQSYLPPSRLHFESNGNYQENLIVNENDTRIRYELNKVERLSHREHSLQQEVNDYRKQVEVQKETIAKLTTDVSYLQKIEVSYQQTQSYIGQLKTELHQTNLDLQGKRQECIQKDLLLQEAEQELTALRKLHQDMIKTHERKRQEDLSKLAYDYSKLQTTSAEKEKQFIEAKEVYESQIRDLFKQIHNYQQEMEATQIKLGQIRQIEKLENDNLVLHQLLQEQLSKTTQLEKQIKRHPTVIKDALTDAKKREAHHDQKMSFLIKDNEAKEALIKQLKTQPSESTKLKEQLSQQASEIYHLKQELEDCQVQIEELEAQIQHEQQQHDSVVASLNKEHEQEMAHLTQQYQDELRKSESTAREQRMQMEKLKKDLELWRVNAQESIKDETKDQNLSLIIQGYDQEISLLAQKMREQKDTIADLRQKLAQK